MQVLLNSDTLTRTALSNALIQKNWRSRLEYKLPQLGISDDDVIKKTMFKETVVSKFTTAQDVAEAVWRFAGLPDSAPTR